MEKQYLILGIHNHQPVGNFDFVLEECCQKAYLPFLEVLKAHPDIKVSLHYSGILWDWFLEESSPVLDLLALMVKRGQIELLSGGYYEPILAILPDTDKVAQIKKLSQFLFNQFQVRCRGMWLAERVWEPHLVKHIVEAGIDYLALDDLHFRASGLQEEDLHGYYLTEEQGETLKVFPGSKYLRYSIPFKNPQDTLDHILSNKSNGNLTLMADDGEKFGVWPGTYDLSYRKGWLAKFFDLIEENRDSIEILTFSEYLDRFPALGKIYLPTASYSEMEEWSLPTKTGKDFLTLKEMINSAKEPEVKNSSFLRGGYWRNFLIKYSESNYIYRKMLWVSKQLENYQKGACDHLENKKWLEEAHEELWKGQCNDAYWHGLFGGLYLPHLRHGVYAHLIQAENILDKNTRPAGSPWIDCLSIDMDGDGKEEVAVKNETLNFWVDVDAGGSIPELDYRPKAFNLVNSLMRRPEYYHQKLRMEIAGQHQEDSQEIKSIHDIMVSKEKDLSLLLHYDQYNRHCLIDHFFPLDTTLTEFSQGQYQKYGDFINLPYQTQIQSGKDQVMVTLSGQSPLLIEGNYIPIRIEKTIKISAHKSELFFQYRLLNLGESKVCCKFGVEFNLNLLAGRSKDRYYEVPHMLLEDKQLASQGVLSYVEEFHMVDEAVGMIVSFHFNNSPALWRFPIETASNSESGFERVYQCSAILPNWNLELSPNASWCCDFRLTIEDL